MTKTLDTLIPDVHALLTEGAEPTAEHVEAFATELSSLVASRIRAGLEERKDGIRMSGVGRCVRQQWYQVHGTGEPEEFSGQTLLKFMIGDIVEAALLYLAKEAGHTVTHEQAEVELNGVKGHNDAIIDGVVVDVKTASPYAFRKFQDGSITENDPFGYMEQIAGYAEAHGKLPGAFWAFEKSNGAMALCEFEWEELEPYNVSERIDTIREAITNEQEPPERDHEDVPEGASGNMALCTNCSYCPFKQECWADSNGGMGLRTFIYSKGPKYLTHVEKEPKVYEVTF